MSDDITVDKARVFAQIRHKDQVLKYTGAPYFNHLEEVAELTRRLGGDYTSIAAAYLHDSIEDQNVTREEIELEFGSEVADIVVALSDVEEGNRATRKALARVRLGNADSRTQLIKIADLVSNTRSIAERDPNFARVYLAEKEALLTVLTKAPAAAVELARQTLAQAWSSLSPKAKGPCP